MRVDILSLFPEFFVGPLDATIIGQARKKQIIDVRLVNIRDYAEGRHRQVDDRPYGGGPGMLMMAKPVTKAIRSVKGSKTHVVYLSPQGPTLTAKKAKMLAQYEHLVFLCGHYEGIDQRVIENDVDELISIGDYVLTNGCLAALVTLDACLRFVPGVLGHQQAAEQDSFENGILDCPHYTRPEVFEGVAVPEVLLNGNHKEIAKWRYEAAKITTAKARPDLYAAHLANEKN